MVYAIKIELVFVGQPCYKQYEVHILEKLGSIDCLDAFSLLTKYISDI